MTPAVIPMLVALAPAKWTEAHAEERLAQIAPEWGIGGDYESWITYDQTQDLEDRNLSYSGNPCDLCARFAEQGHRIGWPPKSEHPI